VRRLGQEGTRALDGRHGRQRRRREEQLDAEKLKKVIDRFVYTGQEPLKNPDIADIIVKPMKIMERGPTVTRVFERVVDYVTTFIRGMAA
jgi:type I restriction enzyme R subunit